MGNSSSNSSDPFLRVATQAREAIDSARDAQESVRVTRRRIRLRGFIASWRQRPARDAAVELERLALILDTVRDEANAPMGNIQLFESGALHIRVASGLSEQFLTHFAEVHTGECCCGAAFKKVAPVVVHDVRTSPLFETPDRDMLLSSGINAVQSLPLLAGERRLGVISLHYRESEIPARRQATFEALGPEIAEATTLALCS